MNAESDRVKSTDAEVAERRQSWVRAILAIMFGAAVCYGFLWGRVGTLPLVSPDAFSTIAIAVILWWFSKAETSQRARDTVDVIAAVSAQPKPTNGTANTVTTTRTEVTTLPTPSDLGPIPGKTP